MGNTRVTGREQYYTPAAVAAELCAEMQAVVADWEERHWIEPAAGTGAFLDAMRKAGVKKILAWDVEPKAEGIIEADFLTLGPLEIAEAAGEPVEGAVCLTNPPFGRNNALSIPFFNQAAPYCDYIGFIVPRSWRKWSVINRLHPNFHLIADRDLDITYVDETGEPLTDARLLNTVFQIWERRSEPRPKITVEDRGYIEKTTPEEADVALVIFGRSCGELRTSFPREPNTTLMFLKVSGPEVIEALQTVDYSRFYRNVAYVEALSLPEINFLLNEHFDARRAAA